MTAVRTHPVRGLMANSFALLATTHVTALLGYAFWMLCARCLTADVIGVANTVISAMTLVSIVVVSGFLPMLTRLMPGATPAERNGLFSTAIVFTVTGSSTVGVLAALLMPERLKNEVGIGWLIGLLGTGAVCTALLLVVNAALLGVRRAELSLVGGVVGSVARLAAIGVVVTFGVAAVGVSGSASHTVLVIWVVSLFITLVLSVFLLASATPNFHFHAHRIWFDRMRSSLGWEYVATLAIRSPLLAIPILAAAHFPPEQIGYLAVVVMIQSAFLAVAASVSNSLLADCADDPTRLQAQARRASRLIALLLLVPVIITCLLAKEILSIFGDGYANYSPLLILVLLSTFPDALINVAIAILRVEGRLAVVAMLSTVGATISIVGAWLLMPHLGIFGAGLAVFTSQVLLAVAFAVVCFRRRGATVPGPAETPAADDYVLDSDINAPILPTPRQFASFRRAKSWKRR